MIEIVLGLVVVGFLAVLVFGLVTRRIAWRQEACCAPGDPAHDLRMRDTHKTDLNTTPMRRPAP